MKKMDSLQQSKEKKVYVDNPAKYFCFEGYTVYLVVAGQLKPNETITVE